MSAKDTVALTPRQTELLYIMCRCFNGKPDIDLNKFVKLGGFSNVESARSNLNKILRKVANTGEEGSGAAGEAAPQTTEKKSAPRKSKAATDEGDDAKETPAKKKVAPKKKSGAKKTSGADVDDRKKDKGAIEAAAEATEE